MGSGARQNIPANFEGGQMPIHMRLPKLKGFKNPFKVSYQVVNVARLAELFPEGGDVRVEDLVEKGLSILLKALRLALDAGVDAIQVFDSWAGTLSLADYRTHVLPHSARVFTALAGYGVPMTHFGVGTAELLGERRGAVAQHYDPFACPERLAVGAEERGQATQAL